jgi:hypothetical protein
VANFFASESAQPRLARASNTRSIEPLNAFSSLIDLPSYVAQCPKGAASTYCRLGAPPVTAERSTIARKKVLHYLTLDIIGDTPARPGDKAGDLSLDLLLTRLKNSAEDAPQYTGLVCVGTALGRILVPEARAKIPVICCISHVSISRLPN